MEKQLEGRDSYEPFFYSLSAFLPIMLTEQVTCEV